MYVTPISPSDVSFGKSVWQRIRGNDFFRAAGAFWLFESEPNEWRLLIATPRVDEVGSRKAYREFTGFTRDLATDSDQLLRIVLISPKLPFYQALRSIFGQTASVEGAHLGNTQVGGTYIDDAYLYEIR